MAAEGDPVEQTARQAFVAQYLNPVAEGKISGNDERGLLVQGDATVDEIVHELPSGVDFYPDRRAESFNIPHKEVVDDHDQLAGRGHP